MNFYQMVKNDFVPFLKKLFCDHVYQTWDMRMVCENDKRFDGNIIKDRYRKCVKCGRCQELKMIPRDFKWVKSYQHLPSNKNIIDVEIILYGQETKRQKRDRIIRDILS